MTMYEQARKDVTEGKTKTPVVSTGKGNLDYFWFQFASHHFWMKTFAAGMISRQINLKTLKGYYGLKSRSAKDCLVEFETIMNDYKAEMEAKKEVANG